MAKKNFSGGIDSLFQKNDHETKKQAGEINKLEDSESTRTTIIVNVATYEKIKAIAYWERKSIKDIIEIGFKYAISQYSDENLLEILESYRQSNS